MKRMRMRFGTAKHLFRSRTERLSGDRADARHVRQINAEDLIQLAAQAEVLRFVSSFLVGRHFSPLRWFFLGCLRSVELAELSLDFLVTVCDQCLVMPKCR